MKIVDFYNGVIKHPSGHSIEDIWLWDDYTLEKGHTYIQYLFPLKEKSKAVPKSPVISDEEVAMFLEDKELRKKLLKSFLVMLDFYGLKSIKKDDNIVIKKSNEYNEKKENWQNIGNHNHLRITRILKSLTMLGLPKFANAFYKCLKEITQEDPAKFSETTINFWKESVKNNIDNNTNNNIESMKKNIEKKHIQDYGNHKIFEVPGHILRAKNRKFGDFFDWGIHTQIDEIPKNEVWISSEIDDVDKFVAMAAGSCELEEINEGKSEKEAYDKCFKLQKRLRKKIVEASKNPHMTNKNAKEEIHIESYKILKDKDGEIKAWIVDGEKVRDIFDVDYIEGGHGYVYDYVPNKEIWLDNKLNKDELDAVLVHEYTELLLMRDHKLKYEDAHIKATKAEYKVRNKRK
jgi:hypothetical protein